MKAIRLLDVVALTEGLPERGLRHGQVGTVVEMLGPEVFEVEFSDDQGSTYASLALRTDQGNQRAVRRSGHRIFGNSLGRRKKARDKIAIATRGGDDHCKAIQAL